MKRVALALVAALLLFGASDVLAQETAHGSASITIPTLLWIDVTNLTVTFESPDLDDYDAGSIEMSSAPSVVSTRGNIVHRVTIAADVADMTGPTTKPAGHLEWAEGPGGVFAGLTTGGADVVTDLPRGQNSSVAEVSYRMVLDEAIDEPGTYSLAFTYTVLAN